MMCTCHFVPRDAVPTILAHLSKLGQWSTVMCSTSGSYAASGPSEGTWVPHSPERGMPPTARASPSGFPPLPEWWRWTRIGDTVTVNSRVVTHVQVVLVTTAQMAKLIINWDGVILLLREGWSFQQNGTEGTEIPTSVLSTPPPRTAFPIVHTPTRGFWGRNSSLPVYVLPTELSPSPWPVVLTHLPSVLPKTPPFKKPPPEAHTCFYRWQRMNNPLLQYILPSVRELGATHSHLESQ